MAVIPQRYRFTVNQCHRMADAGIFHPECRVELIDGEIFEMAPIEVANTSLRYDRGRKLPLYARASVSEVWIVNRQADAVEVFRGPSGGSYAEEEIRRRGQFLTPAAFPDLRLSVGDVLG